MQTISSPSNLTALSSTLPRPIQDNTCPQLKVQPLGSRSAAESSLLECKIEVHQPRASTLLDTHAADLESCVSTLWSEHRAHISETKKSKQALKETRIQLAANLADLKSHLAGSGRDGRWAAYLREQSIPLSTADRYVEAHRKAQAGPKLLCEELAKVTPEQIRRLAEKVAASVTRTLKETADLEAFQHELRLLFGQRKRSV